MREQSDLISWQADGDQTMQLAAKRQRQQEVCFAIAPQPLPTDVQVVQAALGLQKINMDAWLLSLSIKELEDLKTSLSTGSRTGNVDYIANANLPYINEMKALESLEERMTLRKNWLRALFKSTHSEYMSSQGGGLGKYITIIENKISIKRDRAPRYGDDDEDL